MEKEKVLNAEEIRIVDPKNELYRSLQPVLQTNNWRKMHGYPVLRKETKKKYRKYTLKKFNPADYLTAKAGETTNHEKVK